MRNFLAILSVLFLFTNIHAQTNSLGKNDPEAKKVLDAVSAKFKTYKSLKGNFTLEVKDGAGKVQGKKNGAVSMKGIKYRVSINGQEIFCDGKNVWTYDKAANEVQIAQFDNSSASITPQKLFTNFYDKDFLYKLNGEKKVGTKTIQEVELTPTDKSKPFFKVLLSVDKATKMIPAPRFEKSGNRYSYSMSNVVTNSNITDDTFVFDTKKYLGVEGCGIEISGIRHKERDGRECKLKVEFYTLFALTSVTFLFPTIRLDIKPCQVRAPITLWLPHLQQFGS
jgi:outer membrane lipoprotein-sorting protein